MNNEKAVSFILATKQCKVADAVDTVAKSSGLHRCVLPQCH